jgi:mycothiol synthase
MTTDIQTLPVVRLRPARWSDINAVAQLTLDVCTADGDPTVATSIEDLQRYWHEPGFNLETETWVAETSDGRIVGYEELYDRHAHAALEGDGYVHPDFNGRGIGTSLLKALETRALELMQQAEPDLRVFLRNGMSISDTLARELHEHEGYRPIRFSWRMELTLDAPPPKPRWPHGLELHPFVAGEHAHLVHQAVEEAFRDHWGYVPMRFENWKNYTLLRESFDPTLWLIAWDGPEIAGVSLNRFRSEIGWVGSLGVRRPWRRKGLGLALLQQSFGEFYRRGIRTIGLGVDAENPSGATRLYQRAGMKIASEYVIYEKELRPGREVQAEEGE